MFTLIIILHDVIFEKMNNQKPSMWVIHLNIAFFIPISLENIDVYGTQGHMIQV
jgi:hypothetical protein